MRNTAVDAIWSGSAEAIYAAFELTVPEAFLSVVQRVAASCSSQSEFVDFFSETCLLSFGGPECRYYSTPPELFPFGTMGVDGVHRPCCLTVCCHTHTALASRNLAEREGCEGVPRQDGS
jgi:hypothetical protein